VLIDEPRIHKEDLKVCTQLMKEGPSWSNKFNSQQDNWNLYMLLILQLDENII
jgi:hypothetical protein